VPFYEGSCGDAALVDEVISRHHIDTIFHFAADIVVSESVEKPLTYYENNVANAQALLTSAVRNGVTNFVFSSSAAVYGEPNTAVVIETQALSPINPYGRSKLVMEWMLEDAARAHPLRFAALRYFNVAGADPQGRAGQTSFKATHLIKMAVQAALGRRDGLDVFGTDYPTRDGSCIRDYVHVSDLARGHLDALAYLDRHHTSITCNIGYARGYSVLDVIETVKEVSKVNFTVRHKPRRAGDPASLVASNDRALRDLGWQPQHADLAEIVRHALAWETRLDISVATDSPPLLPSVDGEIHSEAAVTSTMIGERGDASQH
jgi:UDP-glucose 4-epimerase